MASSPLQPIKLYTGILHLLRSVHHFTTPSLNRFSAQLTANGGFFCFSDSFPSLSISQPLKAVNPRTAHLLCSQNTPGFARDVTLSLLTITLSRTITHKHVHTCINANRQTRETDASVSDRVAPMCDKCCLAPLLLCFIGSQRHRMASECVESVGNWVQKWHVALRSDRLGAICSVFAVGGAVEVLRTDEEIWKPPA